MEVPERRCTDCWAGLGEARSDAKRCPPCRLHQMLSYSFITYSRPKRCRGCGAKHRPIHARNTAQCVKCNPRYGVTEPVPCLMCKTEQPPVVPSVQLCIYCASGTETQKKAVMALARGRNSRREQNGWTEQ